MLKCECCRREAPLDEQGYCDACNAQIIAATESRAPQAIDAGWQADKDGWLFRPTRDGDPADFWLKRGLENHGFTENGVTFVRDQATALAFDASAP
jgi:hypothetical protein